MAAFAGFNGTLRLNGATLRVTSYECDITTDAIDTTHFENQSNTEQWTPGLLAFVMSCQAYWKSDENPFAAPLNIHPGRYVNTLIFIPEKVSFPAVSFAIPRALVTQCRFQQSVRDIIKYDLTLKASGDSATSVSIVYSIGNDPFLPEF